MNDRSANQPGHQSSSIVNHTTQQPQTKRKLPRHPHTRANTQKGKKINTNKQTQANWNTRTTTEKEKHENRQTETHTHTCAQTKRNTVQHMNGRPSTHTYTHFIYNYTYIKKPKCTTTHTLKHTHVMHGVGFLAISCIRMHLMPVLSTDKCFCLPRQVRRKGRLARRLYS